MLGDCIPLHRDRAALHCHLALTFLPASTLLGAYCLSQCSQGAVSFAKTVNRNPPEVGLDLVSH